MIIIKIPLEIFRIFYMLIFQVCEDNKTLETNLLIRETHHETSFSQKEPDPTLSFKSVKILYE